MSKKLPDSLYSRNGYEGCFGSLMLNGQLKNLLSNIAIYRSMDGNILQGCKGESERVDRKRKRSFGSR